MAPPPLVHVGERYGSLVVVRLETQRRRRNRVYRCECDCGQRTSVTAANLRLGVVQSCGCRRVEVAGQLGRDPRYAEIRFGGSKNPVTRAHRRDGP